MTSTRTPSSSACGRLEERATTRHSRLSLGVSSALLSKAGCMGRGPVEWGVLHLRFVGFDEARGGVTTTSSAKGLLLSFARNPAATVRPHHYRLLIEERRYSTTYGGLEFNECRSLTAKRGYQRGIGS